MNTVVTNITYATGLLILILLTVPLQADDAPERSLISVHPSASTIQFLQGGLPASNRLTNHYFWEYSSQGLARSGFDDGDLHPFKQWPPEHALGNGSRADATPGTFKGRRCVQLYWNRSSYDHWKEKNNARLGKGIEVESPWKNGGFTSRKEIWYRFDLFVPHPKDPQGGFPNDKRQGIAQVFQITDGDGGSWAAMLAIEDNKLLLRHRNPSKEVVAVNDIPRGKWKNVTLHTVASNENNGTVELWYGGKKVYTETDTNFGWGADFTSDDRLVEDDYMFVKCGHYAFNADNYNPQDERTLYYDNITNFSGDHGDMTLRIEAENFLPGGQGRTYSDDTRNNIGNSYRPNGGVDIGKAKDDGHNSYFVGWTEPGEWMDYKLHVPKTDTYDVKYRVASRSNDGIIRVQFEGKGASKKIPLKKTGGKQKWTTVKRGHVQLNAGTHRMRLFVVEGGFKLNWFELAPKTAN